MRHSLPLRAITLSLLLVAGGCASAPRTLSPEARAAELLSTRPAPAGRSCEVLTTPETLPAPADLVDLPALRADLRDLPGRPEEREGHVLLSLGYDRFGSNIRREVIEHDVTTAVADSVQKLFFKHRRTLEEGEAEWGVRMRIPLTGDAEPEVGRQEFCAPRPRDSQLAMAMETERYFGGATRVQNGFRISTIWVRVWVAPDGLVTGATVERGMVPGIAVEQRVFDYVRSIFFEPALADGHPVGGFTSVPVQIRQR